MICEYFNRINYRNIFLFCFTLISIGIITYAVIDYETLSQYIDFTILIHIVFLTSTGSLIIFVIGDKRKLVLTLLFLISVGTSVFLAILFHQKYTMIPNILLSILTSIPVVKFLIEFYKNYKKNIKISVLPDEKYYENCPICLEELMSQTSIIKLSCDHRYHKSCYQQWKGSCPQCRQETTHIVEEHLNI